MRQFEAPFNKILLTRSKIKASGSLAVQYAFMVEMSICSILIFKRSACGQRRTPFRNHGLLDVKSAIPGW